MRSFLVLAHDTHTEVDIVLVGQKHSGTCDLQTNTVKVRIRNSSC